MKPLKIQHALVVFLVILSAPAFAANRYWVAASASTFSNTANWSTTSGGTGGASVPGSGDVAIFDRGSSNCTLTAATTIGGITMSGYTGTIDMVSYNFTISASALVTLATGVITSSTGTTAVLSITNTNQTTFSGTQIGTSLTLAPQLTVSSFDLFLSGSVFYSVANFTKTGSNLDYSGTGGNTFNAAISITNSGSATIATGYSAKDIYNGDVTFNNTGTSDIEAANNTAGNQFNGNIIVNNPNGGAGVTFAAYSGSSAVLASGKTITVGTTFTGGQLALQRFTTSGTTAQTLTLTGTAALVLGPTSVFGGNVTFKSPRVELLGATYSGTAYIEKSGATEDYANTGGNTFNGVTTLVNSGSANLITGYSNKDVFNADVTLTNTGSAAVRVGDNTSGNSFNGNIFVNSTAGSGIIFDQNGGGYSTLSSGYTISVGSTGFTAGALDLYRFTQAGTTASTITMTGSSTLNAALSSFGAALTVSAPAITLQSNTFTGAVVMTNTTNSATSYGGNAFNSTSSFTNSGTGTWTFANNAGDTYVGDATFAQSSTGAFRPAYTGTNYIKGNMIVNSSTAITFGANSGVVQISGTSAQAITSANSIPVINYLTMANPSGLTLNNEVTIGTSAYLSNGVINTTAANFLNFAAGSAWTGGSNSSYVNGPVQKTGNTAFTFPVGGGGYLATLGISAPVNTTDRFTATYLRQDPNAANHYTTSHAATIDEVDDLEYWDLSRGGGSAAVSVTLSWATGRSGTITDAAGMTVAQWSSSLWADDGNGGTTGNTSAGTVTSSSTMTSFGFYTLATTTADNVLPLTFGDFGAVWSTYSGQKAALLSWQTLSETNNSYFEIERSSAEVPDWTAIGQVNSKGNTTTGYSYTAWDLSPLTGTALYRIKQVNIDGSYTYSKTVSLSSASSVAASLRLWPNPAVTTAYLELSQLNGQQVAITVTDAGGRTVARQVTTVGSDLFEIPVSTTAWSAGVYFVTVKTTDSKYLFTQELLIKK